MSRGAPPLPVEEALPALRQALAKGRNAVLTAPPGAGKTTRVPAALLEEAWCDGRIIVLEPRRIAARGAARFVAAGLGQKPGDIAGYRVRMESRTGPDTRIEYVTEGVFSRMILDDPELSGVSAVLFDEFHERNLDADLGLVLALDAQAGLRPDLRLLVMSATLAGKAVASLLGDAPVIESAGRAFPVEIRYRDRPPGQQVEEAVAAAIRDALATEQGSLLAFLPGRREIRRVEELLDDRLGGDVDLHCLYGAMPVEAQDDAMRPASAGRRKVVLATAIAETSITIDGVRIIVDAGLERVPRFEPSTGLTRLETLRASLASVDQRAGRAGRTASGIAIRLWREQQNAALRRQRTPQIAEADLTGLVLDLAEWGVRDPSSLSWLDMPPQPAWNEARAQMRSLGALDESGGLTPLGRDIRKLPFAPSLASMVVRAAAHGQAMEAALLALLLSERGLGGTGIDLETRLSRLRRDKSRRTAAAKQMAAGIADRLPAGSAAALSCGALLSWAFPGRIASNRGKVGSFVMANGRGCHVDEAEPLATAPFIVAADVQGKAAGARVTAAARIEEAEIADLHGAAIAEHRHLDYDEAADRMGATITRRLGAIELGRANVAIDAQDDTTNMLFAYLRERGLDTLPWNAKTRNLRDRLAFLHHHDPNGWPGLDASSLLAELDDWLAPFLSQPKSLADLAGKPLLEGLRYRVTLAGHTMQEMDRLAPETFLTPAGTAPAIDYAGDEAVLAVRVQELYGLDRHPTVLDGRLPLKVELLSPAGRPVQVTTDLPGFWRGSWADVRVEMRGRYPKHFWPQDPANAPATSRVRPPA